MDIIQNRGTKVLTNAKKDTLALVKASLASDKEVQSAMGGHQQRLKKAFDILSAKSGRSLKLQTTMDSLATSMDNRDNQKKQ